MFLFENMYIFLHTFLGMPIKEREGASVGGKVCSKRGPTLPSSTTTIPLVSRNGNEYAYLHSLREN